MRRQGTAGEVADAAVFLLSHRAAYVTGRSTAPCPTEQPAGTRCWHPGRGRPYGDPP
ncbi:SDR family oxidoreductase [Actinomadura rubrisoli]|uniref:SDR family oxidoreductase n=1 Tax=Actinomadura rubrisoli TaxID=2530368 RepID=UPI0014043989|nr:SDR family oxidoreductase [Actinomadura rubrisoli]